MSEVTEMVGKPCAEAHPGRECGWGECGCGGCYTVYDHIPCAMKLATEAGRRFTERLTDAVLEKLVGSE